MLRRILLSALLASSFAGCDHVIGGVERSSGVTPIGNTWFAQLGAVYAVSDEEVYIVGANGMIGRVIGSNLERIVPESLTERADLREVAANASGDVVVSGFLDNQHILVTLRDGVWSRQTLPLPEDRELFSIFRMASLQHTGGSDPDRIVLVGNAYDDDFSRDPIGQVTTYVDGAFSTVNLPGNPAYVWDVSAAGGALYYWHPDGVILVDGETTENLPLPPEVAPNLLAVSDGTGHALVTFSSDGNFHTLRDGVWTATQTSVHGINAIDGRAWNNLYAVGWGGAFFHFDGESWKAIPSGTREALRDLHVLPNGNVYVVGDNGAAFIYAP